jgi:cytoskeleton protein RodZ
MDETAATAAPLARSIGERLRAGRERAGLSVAATAEKLHLDNKVIESLEADRFSDLGASVFVRGHLRRYADFVGEPGLELVELYEKSRTARPPAPDLTQAPQARRKVDSRQFLTPVVGVACAAVIAAAIWWIVAGSRSAGDESGTAPAAADVTVAVPSNDDITAVPDASVLAGMQSTATAPAVPVAVPAPAQAARVAQAPADSPKPEVSARGTQLTLRVSSESWVEVYDASGKQLYFDVAGGGTVQSMEGRPPLRVMLGNAAGVTVEVDGKSREIPGAAIDGEGARFVVNRSGSLSRSR